MRNPVFVFFLVLVSLFSAFSTASAVVPALPDVPASYVIDLAGIIDEQAKRQLDSYLRELEQKTTAQMVVLTVNSLEGESIDGFSIKTVEKWKLGQKGKDNGVLFLVALKDRRYRFEIGYGLEGILPDSLVGSIGREFIAPNFRKGNFGAGITNATLAVIRTLAGHEGVEITGMPAAGAAHTGGRGREIGLPEMLLLGVLAVAVVILVIRNPWLLFFFFGGGGGWSGGGGFGGGDSGFGGGGGGGFGGGGASGGF